MYLAYKDLKAGLALSSLWPPGNPNDCRQEQRTGATLQNLSVLAESMHKRKGQNVQKSGE